MRIFKNPWFTRFASKEGIQDSELRDIVNNVLETGQADADLGGGVYKVRIARPGMEWKGKYKSELLMVLHTDAQAMHKAGVISDKEMREYDRDCLVVSPPKKSSNSTGVTVKTIPAYAGSSRNS